MSFPFPTATIPDLPNNATPPTTSLLEISNSGVSENTSISQLLNTAGVEFQTNKGAVSGYAGLDASQELLLANFPSGAALQVLRRNAGNTALEFATIASGEFFGPWTANHDAGGFALTDASFIEVRDTETGNFPLSGAVRLVDVAALVWNNVAEDAEGAIYSDDLILNFEGFTDLVTDISGDIGFINANTITASSASGSPTRPHMTR